MRIGHKKHGLLIEAVRAHDLERTRQLLSDGADPNDRDRGGIPALIHAAKENLPEIVRLLIHHGADVNMPEPLGTTPLMYAARDSLTVLDILIDSGADLERTDKNGDTAISWAFHLRCDEAFERLFQASERQKNLAAERTVAQNADELVRQHRSVAAKRLNVLRRHAPRLGFLK